MRNRHAEIKLERQKLVGVKQFPDHVALADPWGQSVGDPLHALNAFAAFPHALSIDGLVDRVMTILAAA